MARSKRHCLSLGAGGADLGARPPAAGVPAPFRLSAASNGTHTHSLSKAAVLIRRAA